MRGCTRNEYHGSALVLVLGILAMLAVMGTTFIAMMSINARLGRVYTDDLTTEMLASGVENYCLAVLRDDQDRTVAKYENRDQAVGDFRSYSEQGSHLHVPGRNTDWWASENTRYATTASNDVWFHSADAYAYATHTDLYGGRANRYEAPQASFGGEYFRTDIFNEKSKRITNPNDQKGPQRYYGLVRDLEFGLGYDLTAFLTHGYRCYLQPGRGLAGNSRLPGGQYWRWAAKIGTPEERYVNLNSTGNNERITPASRERLEHLDEHGLAVRQNSDDTVAPHHLGILAWKGYPGEFKYKKGGFHKRYNAVQYSPYQLDPFRVLAVQWVNMINDADQPPPLFSTKLAGPMATEWVKERWGEDSLPADGTDKWRIGWRRDGATYYKIPSPDNPMDDAGGSAEKSDHYFGASEALSHQNEDIVSGTSRVFDVMEKATGSVNRARVYFGRARGYVGTHGCDTILRGKIWPTEGPLPWRPNAQQGDWRHIDILRRVNLNMIGASGAEPGDSEELAKLKNQWRDHYRDRERVRLYFMLKALLQFTKTAKPEHEACQLIASLADMVDRDQKETCFRAPDGSGEWALGVEKHPVINEIALQLTKANIPGYELFRFRVELYNAAENIPWIRDNAKNDPWVPNVDETYDVSEYVIKLGTHTYRLGDLTRYGARISDRIGPVRTIGADGLWGVPQARGVKEHQTWSRFLHIGWDGAGVGDDWPSGLTKDDIEANIKISLWKPLYDDANTNVPLSSGKVEKLFGNDQKYICVDRTPPIKLVKPYDATGGHGPGGSKSNFVGIYRRWDPMNALAFASGGKNEKGNLLWCPGWTLAKYATLGMPNTNYPINASKYPSSRWNGQSTSPFKYKRTFETNFKVPDSDLPSVGWLGELFLRNCAQDKPLTWMHKAGQNPEAARNAPRCVAYSNRLELAKMDLFRPWKKVHNLNLFDMFTVRDPMHDGIDNDGDGAIDDEDTGCQTADLLGPEVRIYGVYDMNHAARRVVASLWPGHQIPYLYYVQTHGLHLERGIDTWVAQGPRETIGDMVRGDSLHGWPARWTGEFGWHSSSTNYASSYNLVGEGGKTKHGYGKYVRKDDDGDGILDERDERDFWFTQAANYMTTRSHTFTIEIVTQLAEPPYYRADQERPTYNTNRVHAEKHLILLVDRSTTLRIRKNKDDNDRLGPCDFTGPVRVLARRWAHQRR